MIYVHEYSSKEIAYVKQKGKDDNRFLSTVIVR